MDIRCKVAVITGGSCGVGFTTANELLCQEVYVSSINIIF